MSIFLPHPGDSRVQDLISEHVISPTGNINDDFKEALGQALGLTIAQIKAKSIDDLWKQYIVDTLGFTFQGNHINNYADEPSFTFPAALSFTPESGFGGSGTIKDLESYTITAGSGFGTKSQAASKVFDTFDTYYNNGTAETPYSALNSGDNIPFSSNDPFDSNLGVWRAEAAAAYGRRTLGYQTPSSSGSSFDYFMDGWRGWIAPEGNKIYVRWYFWIEESGHIKQALDGAHSTSATVLTVTPGSVVINDASPSSFHTVVVVLDDASFHRTVQADPKLTPTTLNITDGLASAAADANDFYFRLNDSTKFIRIWDVASGASDLLQLSWTWTLISAAGNNNNSDTDAIPRAGGSGTWNLMEIEVFHPQEEVDEATGEYKAWLNGTQIGSTVTGDISNAGTWPFSGIVPRGIGQNTSAPVERWLLPDNFVRLAEIYADTTTQRVEIGDHATDLFSSTIREVCQLSAWSDTSITFIINQGLHSSLKDKYVYFVDDTNSATLVGQYT